MSGFQALFLLAVMFCELCAIPIVLKESSPNGESIIAISSSDPEVEKYILEHAAEHAKQKQPQSAGRAQGHGTVVQSFSVASPGKTIAGTGRSFGDDSFTNPFFVPYFTTSNLEGFDISNWLRNLERLYDPSFVGNGASVSATTINDNGRVYGKIETVNLDSKGGK